MLVKVVNDNAYPYKEKFRGKEIYIESKGSIEMDENEAHLFLGTMPPVIEVDANDIQKPTSYKMLRIEKLGQASPKVEDKKFICHACSKDLVNKAGYESHIEEFHFDQLEDKAVAEKIEKKRGRPPKVVKDDANPD